MCHIVLYGSCIIGTVVSVVKWNGVFSYPFSVYCGVRQGGVLSPLLFNIYVDDLIHQLEASNYGCYVTGKFFGCIMYADDLLVVSDCYWPSANVKYLVLFCSVQ